jgi:2-oxoglutarate dehydrogenase E2 component (dihydrolipoamide succinyltransferase)
MRTELKVPSVGESISEVEIGEWKKAKGDSVQKDDTIVLLESEKATVDLPAPASGVLAEVTKRTGETAKIGDIIGYIDDAGTAAPAKTLAGTAHEPSKSAAAPAPRVMPAAERTLAERGLRPEEVTATGPGGRLLKEDVLRQDAAAAGKDAVKAEAPAPAEARPARKESPPATPPARVSAAAGDRSDEVVPMTRLRRTVAERLVQAQQNAALLTTFNEIDLSAVIELRKEFGEAFQAKYGAKLGFMSFFVRATAEALQAIPQVNGEIRGQAIVLHKYCDIGVAIGGGKGLVVPVLRNAERMSFAEIEVAIAEFARRARENKLKPEELQGGTFTISNGGVYGSLLSTPIVNPPQSGVLGMHAIQERPVARAGQVVIRPMMYAALTYDHRLIDGQEAVTFLKRIKDTVESPARLMLGI